MGMRRESRVMASSLFHLTNSSIPDGGITKCRKLKRVSLSSHPWLNAHTKRHDRPYSPYLVIKCVQTVIAGQEVSRLVIVRIVMRRVSWRMASSSRHLASLKIRHYGSIECRKLRIMR
jgi:hypothetical protein